MLFSHLPSLVSCQCPSVQRVRSWYITSFVELQKFVDIRTVEDELAFTDALRAILKRHEHVVPGIAQVLIRTLCQSIIKHGGRTFGVSRKRGIGPILSGRWLKTSCRPRMMACLLLFIAQKFHSVRFNFRTTSCSTGAFCRALSN